MAEANQGRPGFRPGWRMTAFLLVMLPVVVGLGFWQLERAQEKRTLDEAYLKRLTGLPEEPGADPADFQRLRLSGHYDARYFLLDNQIREGSVGFGVIGVFQADDGRRWLINRGFVAGDPTRERLPTIKTPDGRSSIVGVAWPDLGLMPVFGEDRWMAGWPKVIQRVELMRMAREIDVQNGGRTMLREIRLEAGQPGVLTAPGMEMNMPAGKHTGYAAQWFGLGIVLAVGYVIFGFKRHDR